MRVQTSRVPLATLVGLLVLGLCINSVESRRMCRGKRSASTTTPSPDSHGKVHAMFHSHMSKKVFDRACSASKDVIDEIVGCMNGNSLMMKHMNDPGNRNCFKESFGIEFDPKDVTKHRDLICKQRDKFEEMVSCSFLKISESSTAKDMESLTEAMVDVGLCVINAIDG